MTDLFRAITFNDDVLAVCDAFSEWCKVYGVNPDSVEGSLAASRFIDLFQAAPGHKTDLLAAAGEIPAR
ncbi:hypothetical protein [Rhizobium sp. BK376]|uniref:hypothetical protein n=1 Tax=Rhizobium sp. BK376 TaxID=2512149 RepID=UPI00104451E6|nr:hypothetical protein [Rhizobium sp. BK376]TCR66685.1 hypothetical protein EV561_1544 [Rhizobium sp. BK376]